MYSSDSRGFNTQFTPQRAGSFAMASAAGRQAQTTMPVSAWGGQDVQSTGCGRSGRCGRGGRGRRGGGGFFKGLFGRLFGGCRRNHGGGEGCRGRRNDDDGGCNGPECKRPKGGEEDNLDENPGCKGGNESPKNDGIVGENDKAPPKTPRAEDKKPETPRNEDKAQPKADDKKPDSPKSPQRKGAPSETDRDKFLEKINALRKSRGLKALVYDDKLNKACENHAKDMAGHHNMSHSGSDGSSFVERMKRVGYRMVGTAAENVAMGSRNAAGVFSQWFNSKGHLANMLNPNVKKIGLGKDGTYWSLTLG